MLTNPPVLYDLCVLAGAFSVIVDCEIFVNIRLTFVSSSNLLSYMQLRESGVEDEDLLLMEADPRAHGLQSRLVLQARLGHIGQNLTTG